GQIRELRNRIVAMENANVVDNLREASRRARIRLPNEPEPLLIVSRASQDMIVWKVVDEFGTPETDFTIQVQPFPGDRVSTTPAPKGTPDAFEGFGATTQVHASAGMVISNVPRAQAVAVDFRWHKFTLRLTQGGNVLTLDPCIFVET